MSDVIQPGDRFWMVYGIGQGRPTYKHRTEGRAEREAERLAYQYPGIKYVVLEAKTEFRRSKPVTRRHLKWPHQPTAELPF